MEIRVIKAGLANTPRIIFALVVPVLPIPLIRFGFHSRRRDVVGAIVIIRMGTRSDIAIIIADILQTGVDGLHINAPAPTGFRTLAIGDKVLLLGFGASDGIGHFLDRVFILGLAISH